MPGLMVKLLFGEMGVELLLQGQCVIPKKLQQSGFEFKYPTLPQALEDLLG
jgi:NAD dependent epimerase/dehydratase family enzyme